MEKNKKNLRFCCGFGGDLLQNSRIFIWVYAAMAAAEMCVLFLSVCTRLRRRSHVSVKPLCCLFPAACSHAGWKLRRWRMRLRCGRLVANRWTSDLSLRGPGHREVSFHGGDRCTGRCASVCVCETVCVWALFLFFWRVFFFLHWSN